ncbi:DUF4268 domain-containing protein [Agrobacterium tumefaciens]|uniref:DUF4268 domain-containing protein n=1 Tax=Agrobacterium tumefaciens TaxID=358 RepID=UPI00157213A2|nr:DUF4268 domain-containing protein [Agrobacterium tumefaciens]NTE33439.1 DUF4268 domain-containing protein [Agrobacterium tumefaciens]NTE48949.1 DUF4268 domain-containing protein [Agrobacterium tumefaciens]
MNFPKLGKLVTLSAKSVWLYEAQTFTPWLADNLDLLGEALGIGELELKSTEVPAGEFRLDILAEDESGNPVLIENQFGKTDHSHLGQLITYMASQRKDATAIWIAEKIREDHRAAIDWLNATTTDGFDFFAVEVEALKIDNSDPAPFFRIVAQPNNWSRAVDAKVAADQDLADRHILRMAYWNSFSEFLKSTDPTFSVRKNNKDHWHEFKVGRSGFAISATINAQKNRVGIELYNHRDPFKIGIKGLERDRADIEHEIGASLEWQELPGKKASRIVLYRYDVDVSDKNTYADIHSWMLDKMQRFRKAFAHRVKQLDLDGEDEQNL